MVSERRWGTVLEDWDGKCERSILIFSYNLYYDLLTRVQFMITPMKQAFGFFTERNVSTEQE